jgi:hypothetical protein
MTRIQRTKAGLYSESVWIRLIRKIRGLSFLYGAINMKITKLETICLTRMHEPERQWITSRYRTIKADCAVVKIHTDEGLGRHWRG